jgi:signal transduction histidine kinase
VEDAGPGVAPGDEEKIFEPFYRGARIPDGVRGTGLGLSIARQLVEAQRGTLTYESRVGGGSRFTLDLPASVAPPE